MYWKYFKYVVKHKWFVFIECCKLGIPIRGLIHDLSKFLPSEFIPYAKYFYGDYLTEKEMLAEFNMEDYEGLVCAHNSKEYVRDQFDLAWLKHQKRNPHHYQYWILPTDDGPSKILPMPKKYVLEMIADWKGAGKAITGKNDLHEWFTKNKENIRNRMNPVTFISVCTIIGEDV